MSLSSVRACPTKPNAGNNAISLGKELMLYDNFLPADNIPAFEEDNDRRQKGTWNAYSSTELFTNAIQTGVNLAACAKHEDASKIKTNSTKISSCKNTRSLLLPAHITCTTLYYIQ